MKAGEARIEDLKQKLRHVIKRSVYVYRVDCGGCNGCEIEIFAAITPVYDAERFGIKVVPSPRHADILLLTGPVTRAMRVPALRAYQAMPDPKIVVAYGACGCSGGIFHDSYAVWGGARSICPVDVYIPGCPPTPAATLHGFAVALDLLQQKIRRQEHAEKATTPVAPEDAGIRPDIVRAIQREARRLAGYWQGKQIASRYLELIGDGDPVAVDRRVKEMARQSGDPRVTEILLRLHRLYLERTEDDERRGEDERRGQGVPAVGEVR
ncbi:MAG TPA: NADH-quinone oxidoreductase subunit B family protein [Thermaerobacter sp.]